MRAPGTWIAVLALVLLVAAAALAEDESGEIWTFTKGDETREVVVTHMPAELRAALKTQLKAQGWMLRSVVSHNDLPKEGAADEGAGPKGAEPEIPEAEGAPPLPHLRKDLEELIRHGGKLPEGFVPHGLRRGAADGPPANALLPSLARAAGTLIQRYLAVKSDPVKGPVYEEALGELAGVLVRVGQGEPVDPQQIGMRLLGRVLGGMSDPQKAAVYGEILRTVTAALAGPPTAAEPPEPPPFVPPAASQAMGFAGATVRAERTPAGHFWAPVIRVPPGSLAAEIGLAVGDAILALDGRRPEPTTLTAIDRALSEPGKLRLQVMRRDGRIDLLEIEFEAADGPGGAGDE